MSHRASIVLALVAAIVAGCGDITLGNLDQYVINWKIDVQDFGSDPATITVTIHDNVQSQTVPAQGSMSVTGFTGGAWSISIVDATKRRAFLENELAQDLAAIAKPGVSSSYLRETIPKIKVAIVSAGDSVVGSGACRGFMNDPTGDSLHVVAAQYSDGGAWYCR
jgi:hypothetical protein